MPTQPSILHETANECQLSERAIIINDDGGRGRQITGAGSQPKSVDLGCGLTSLSVAESAFRLRFLHLVGLGYCS